MSLVKQKDSSRSTILRKCYIARGVIFQMGHQSWGISAQCHRTHGSIGKGLGILVALIITFLSEES